MRAPRTTRRWRATTAAVVALAGLVAALAPTVPAEAAGMTTHSWMAVRAIDEVREPDLRALLEQHVEQVRAGATLPDIGYVSTNTYGEEMHWQRWVDAYAARIAVQPGCTDLTDPDGPCAELVAHLMGIAAHGMGDEVWDWLFEPNGPDLDEYFTDPAIPFFNESGAESQMDVVAIGRYGAPRPQMPPIPSLPLVLAAFADVDRSDVTAPQFDLAGAPALVWDVEHSWVATYLAAIEAAMPWMSANMVTAPGGVEFAATAIAGYWSDLWAGLQGATPTPTVSITYPADGQQGVPATGWERNFEPGSSRGRGGARNRITAALTTARPYRVPGGPGVSNLLPAGSMTITERDSGTPVPVKSGYPRSVPYGADAGEHLVDVQPAEDLAPCTWYRIEVGTTVPLGTAHGVAVQPYHWDFRTDDGAGSACASTSISGRVTGPAAGPVADVRVLAFADTDGFAPTATTTSGPDGRYRFDDLPAGTYRLYFAPDGPGLAPQWSGGARQRADAEAREIPGVDEPLDASLEAAGAVTGVVRRASGARVAGASVHLVAPWDTWLPTATATAAPDGTFALPVLPTGTYRVLVVPPSGPPWWFDGATTRAAATPVAVGTEPVRLTLVLPKG